jgi:hypothetical protein
MRLLRRRAREGFTTVPLRTSLDLTRPSEGSPDERTTAVRRAALALALALDIRIRARIIELRRLAEQTARDGLPVPDVDNDE